MYVCVLHEYLFKNITDTFILWFYERKRSNAQEKTVMPRCRLFQKVFINAAECKHHCTVRFVGIKPKHFLKMCDAIDITAVSTEYFQSECIRRVRQLKRYNWRTLCQETKDMIAGRTHTHTRNLA